MGHYRVKQSLIFRGDLLKEYGSQLSKGKLAAQISHASLGAILNFYDPTTETLRLTPDAKEWVQGDFAKIVLKCDDMDALITLKNAAESKGVNTKLIVDNGTTVFGKPTVTCLAIGPGNAEVIEEITQGLKLL
jgi:PTH2 family peptidyl-tRNA hydrolase